MLNSGLNTGRAPNFPKPLAPSAPIGVSMPSDLVADGRNFYTEIKFVDFRDANGGASELINDFLRSSQNDINTYTQALSESGGIGSFISGIYRDTFNPIYQTTNPLPAIRLPIPININDVMVFNWDTPSITDQASGMIPGPGRVAGQLALQIAGKAVNPLLFAAFNRPNFRTFRFEWNLVPRNKEESKTIRLITETFKYAASPDGLNSLLLVLDYPLIAMVHMYPNRLNGHAYFHPMAIKGVSVNLTPNPTPSFFSTPKKPDGTDEEDQGGAPTLVNLSVEMMEIKLWDRSGIASKSEVLGKI